MIVIKRRAQLTPAGAAERVLDDIACPACGYRDPAATYRLTPGNQVRFFCDGCGAFVTILFTEPPAETAPGSREVPSGAPGGRVTGPDQLERP